MQQSTNEGFTVIEKCNILCLFWKF